MVDERRARELLGEAGRDVPVGATPVDVLVRRGRRSLWQRRAAPVLAVAVVAGVVVGGTSIGGLGDEAEPAGSDDGLTLNTSDWEPGDGADDALVSGRLAVTDSGCVHLIAGDSRTDVVWPAGYTATQGSSGVVVRRPDGQVVATQGIAVKAGGGASSPNGLACRASDGSPFSIQDELPVVDVPTSDVVLNTASEPSSGTRTARIVGAIAASQDGCIHFPATLAGATERDVVFPFGYTAREREGLVEVLDPEGRVVARAGEVFEAAGAASVPAFESMACRAATGDVTLVQRTRPLDAAGTTGPVATESERRLAKGFAAFADSPETGFVPFADEVVLGLGEKEARTVGAESLDDPQTWVFREPFAGRSPTYSALDTVPGPDDDYSVRVGPHDHCASPPIDPPAQLADLRQLSVQPTNIASCLDWFAVDLFVNPRGEIAGVVLDLWEP